MLKYCQIHFQFPIRVRLAHVSKSAFLVLQILKGTLVLVQMATV